MPLWFIDTPSETEMVVAAPAPRRRPPRQPSRIRLRPERHRARRVLAVRADDAHHRLAEVVVVKTSGAQEGAVRRAIEAVDGDARAVVALGAHGAQAQSKGPDPSSQTPPVVVNS